MKNVIPLYTHSKCARATEPFIERLQMLIDDNSGNLTGLTIRNEILFAFDVDAEKEILKTFKIKDLNCEICGLKSALLSLDFDDGYSLYFEVDENIKKCDTDSLSEALSAVYKELNKLQSSENIKMEIGFDRMRPGEINVDVIKDNRHFRITVSKSELDEVEDVTAPIKRAIDIALKQVAK